MPRPPSCGTGCNSLRPATFGFISFLLLRPDPETRNDSAQEKLAEREGFEPSVGFHLHALSKRAHSTTLPPLRVMPGEPQAKFRRQTKGRTKSPPSFRVN